MKPNYLILISILLIFYSCQPEPIGNISRFAPIFPDMPVNMGDINSEFDDYNSTSPLAGETSPLCFSSNRNSQGNNFDLIYKLLDIFFNKSNGKISVVENTSGTQDVYVTHSNLGGAVMTANSKFDELGPYLIPQGDGIKQIATGLQWFQNYIVLYSSNESGDFDIKFTQNLTENNYSQPQNISFLNSDKDDGYPVLTPDTSMIYFCSNREGDFDIYKTDIYKKTDLISAFTDTTSRTATKDSILSSDNDDKCPFIMGNLLVFTSDRLDGYGGFDLYYSVLKDGKWSEPVNFGDKINTPYDEYRPIVKTFGDEFTNDFMIFSSNRPEGKGGFDLYYVGIDKMTR